MPGPLGGRRRRIRAAYAELLDAIAAARGASDALRAVPEREYAEALAELWLREGAVGRPPEPEHAELPPPQRPALVSPRSLAHPEARPRPLSAVLTADGAAMALHAVRSSSRLAHVVDRVSADRLAAGGPPDTALPELTDLVAEHAPGPAGAEPGAWLGDIGTATPADDPPGLWRIGLGRLGATAPPFTVAVPLLDEAHLQLTSAHDTRAAALALVEALVLRVVSAFRPGSVLLHVWDVGQLTGPLPGLRPLAASGLLTVHDPRGLPGLLEELSDRIRRVHTRVLHGGQPALRALGSRRTEPWVVAVLAGNREALREEDHRQLQRVAAGGLACGVQLVLLDVPLTVAAAVETVTLPSGQPVRTSMTGKYVAVELDPPLPPGRVTDACHAVAAAHEEWRSRSIVFADVLPAREWAESSAAGLTAQVGLADGQPAELRLDDMSPHALIGGPSGSGKTNLLLTMIGALTTRYSPDELELHLLDFKEGVSFAPFAPARRAWLPHARLVGVHINTDREFGLALLQFLAAEMRRRAEAAKAHAVTKLEDLRAVDPDGRWPRIVAVIDEFQYLFGERDAVTRAAIALLEDVARRGRSQGIHLVLASQDVSGIEAFWGRRGIFEQFVLRIALPRARQVLDDRNEAALDLPRWHAVVNHESGMRHGNEIVRLPNASARGTFDEVQWRLHRRWTGLRKDRPPPRLFDGSRAPRVADLLPHVPADGPRALVGQSIDVAGSPATVAMPDAPGRNLGVFGAGGRDAVRVLSAAAASLVDRLPTGARVVVAALSPDSRAVGERLARRCAAHDAELVGLDAVRARVEELAAEVGRRLAAGGEHPPVVVVLFAADAADTVLDRAGTEALRKVVHFGPETGVHVLGWWRSVPRLKALLVLGASVDDVGAWVALDVHGAELAALLPGALVAWSSRPGRGLFFDRAQHAEPQVVIVAEPEEGP